MAIERAPIGQRLPGKGAGGGICGADSEKGRRRKGGSGGTMRQGAGQVIGGKVPKKAKDNLPKRRGGKGEGGWIKSAKRTKGEGRKVPKDKV